MLDLEKTDGNQSSFLMKKLGNVLMPLAESFESNHIEQGENGFYIRFNQNDDVLNFCISTLEHIKEDEELTVRISIHSGINPEAVVNEIHKLDGFASTNQLVVSEETNFQKTQIPSHQWIQSRNIQLGDGQSDTCVFSLIKNEYVNSTTVQKNQSQKNKFIKWEFLIPIIIIMCIGLFFFLPKNKIAPKIVVWMMENKGDVENDFWAQELTDELIKKLDVYEAIEVVPFNRISKSILSQKPVEDVINNFGMNYVYLSEFTYNQKGIEIRYVLKNATTEKKIFSHKRTFASKKVSVISDVLSKEILDHIYSGYSNKNIGERGTDPEVYELYLRGKYALRHEAPTEQKRGITFLEQAIKLDDTNILTKSYLAEVYFKSGDLKKAQDLYTDVMTLAAEIKDKQKVREYLISLGDIYIELDEYPNALTCYQNALVLSDELELRDGTPDILKKTALIYVEKDKPDSAIYYLEKSVEMQNEIRDSLKTVDELLILGNLYFNSMEYFKALTQFKTALTYSKIIQDTTEISTALHHLCDIYWIKNDYSIAISYQLELLDLLEKEGDQNSIGWATFRLGNLYDINCNYSQAQAYLKQSLKNKRRSKNKEDIAEVLSYLGLVSIKLGQNKYAIRLFKESKKIYEDLRNREGLGFMSHNLGEAIYYTGQPEESEGYFRKAVTIWRELKIPSSEIWSLSWLVLAEMESGNREFEVDLYILNKLLKQNEIAEQDIPVVHYNLYLVYLKKDVDDKAKYHLKFAWNEIMEKSKLIQSDEDQKLFLTKNPLNKNIIKAWKKWTK